MVSAKSFGDVLPVLHQRKAFSTADTMSFILKYPLIARVSVSRHIRSLATPATSGPSASKKTTFKATLEQGPSLDDFVSGDTPERIVLGNTNTYVTLFSSG
jgi:hypothetical protein